MSTSLKRCERCTPSDIANHVVVDNYLFGADTPDGMPYCLDERGHSTVGMLLCDRCADAARVLGYKTAEFVQVVAVPEIASLRA